MTAANTNSGTANVASNPVTGSHWAIAALAAKTMIANTSAPTPATDVTVARARPLITCCSRISAPVMPNCTTPNATATPVNPAAWSVNP
ncbi:MAG TPA: hypothetical protein VIR00_04400, partial [Micromonosporaceae bacterium]